MRIDSKQGISRWAASKGRECGCQNWCRDCRWAKTTVPHRTAPTWVCVGALQEAVPPAQHRRLAVPGLALKSAVGIDDGVARLRGVCDYDTL